MAISVKVDKSKVLIRGKGRITDTHIFIAHKMKVEHADYKPGLPVLCDFTGVTETSITPFSLKMLADMQLFTPELFQESHMAIIASDEQVYAQAKMFQILTSELPRKLEVFRKKREAVQWLVGKLV
ncbi:MAG: hypothetical protein ACRBF0_13760 [Calditrichia bacterium]